MNGFILWDKESLKNRWICFRKKLEIKTLPKRAIIKIAVDSKYWLYINGKMVIFDGGLNRESLPNCGYFDEFDISPYLRKGNNVFAFLVWYWGNEGRNNVDSKQGGLFVECNDLNLFSDESFRMLVHPCFIETSEPLPSYLYGGHNIGYDANFDIGDWTKLSFNDSHWQKPFLIDINKWGDLYKRPIPLFKFSKLKAYNQLKQSGKKLEAILPYAAQITPYLKIIAKKGIKIDIRTDRYAVNGGPGEEDRTYNSHRTAYITKEGLQEFESLDWLFGESVIYSFSEEVEIIELKYRESGYNSEIVGDFKCENKNINLLVEKCKRTLYVCMRDNYMDCPDRERGQWIGDVSSQIPQTFYCLDRNADFLSKKAINDFISLRKGDVLVGNVPGINFCELPAQSLNAISEIGMIISYYFFSGDTSVLILAYPAIEKYLLLWNMGEDGLVEKRNGFWYWFDHLTNVDEKVLENCWYYSALKSAIKISRIINTNDNIEEFEERIKSIENNFDRIFLKRDGYRNTDVCDDRANAMAVLSGLASDNVKNKIVNILESTQYSTPYMEYYVQEALFKLGEGEIALKRMLNRYDLLIHNENSTLWEDFKSLGTRNHAWSGGPLTILFKYAAGISPQLAGFKEIYILPTGVGLKNISAKMQTSYGEISVKIKHQKKKYILKAIIPQNTSAIIGIPLNCFDDGIIGKTILNSIETIGVIHNNHLVYKISEGRHILEAFSN